MKKAMEDWSSGVSKELGGMMTKIEACAARQQLALTDAAITTVISKVKTALHAQFESEFKEFEDAATAVQTGAVAVTAEEVARGQTDERAQRALLQKLHAGKGMHGVAGLMPATHLRASVTPEEIEQLLQQLQTSRSSRGKGPLPGLDAWRLVESGGGLAPVAELKTIVSALHSDAVVVSQCTNGGLRGPSLKQRLQECLPSSSGAAGVTKTAADSIAVVTEDVLADDLASLNLPAAGERDWVEWGQQQTPSRSINEGVNTETELIRKLAEYEAQKPPASRTKHPPFTHAALLEPQKLDAKQTAVVMHWLNEPRAGLTVSDERRAIARCLPANPALLFRQALAEAARLCDAEVPRYVQQYARLARAVNVSWGSASREWKAWWVLKGLLNLSHHACKECGDCSRFLHYAQCGGRAWRPANLPRTAREHMWSDFTDSAAEPPNIALLASVLVDSFTVSARMRKHSYNSVLFARTASNESLNNVYALWTSKGTHSTVSRACSLCLACCNCVPLQLVLTYG